MRQYSALFSIQVKQIEPITLIITEGSPGISIYLESDDVNLTEIRTLLAEHIKNLKDAIYELGEHPLDISEYSMNDLSNVADAFKKLYLCGRTCFSRFFMRDETKRTEVYSIFRKYYDTFSEQDVYKSQQRIIEVVSKFNDTIPLEFFVLPNLHPKENINIKSKADLLKYMKDFLGYCFIISRVNPRARQSQNILLDNQPDDENQQPALMVKYFFDRAEEEAAGPELTFFKDNKNIELKGPWPDGEVEDFLEDFVSHIFYPDRYFNGEQKSPLIDHVHHFLCHCYSTGSTLRRCCLKFSCNQEAMLEHIEGCHIGHVMSCEDKKDMPFIFLNACGSSVIDPASASFPKFFLEQNENRGFIGTEANLPAFFAPEFSKRFYFHLLTGKSLGHALHLTKWKILTRYSNPLGMLYTLYGSTDLHLRIPVKEEDINME